MEKGPKRKQFLWIKFWNEALKLKTKHSWEISNNHAYLLLQCGQPSLLELFTNNLKIEIYLDNPVVIFSLLPIFSSQSQRGKFSTFFALLNHNDAHTSWNMKQELSLRLHLSSGPHCSISGVLPSYFFSPINKKVPWNFEGIKSRRFEGTSKLLFFSSGRKVTWNYQGTKFLNFKGTSKLLFSPQSMGTGLNLLFQNEK